MKNAINWFEIPVSDLSRAARFYEKTLGIELKRTRFGELDMAIFPSDEPGAGGALVLDPRRQPSDKGSLVYLHAENLDAAVERTQKSGGSVILPKTDIGEPGFMALVRDTEGNTVGLHTPRN